MKKFKKNPDYLSVEANELLRFIQNNSFFYRDYTARVIKELKSDYAAGIFNEKKSLRWLKNLSRRARYEYGKQYLAPGDNKKVFKEKDIDAVAKYLNSFLYYQLKINAF